MKKLNDLLFYVFLIFLIVSAVWPFYPKINYIFIGLFLVLSILIIIFNLKKIRLDKIDFLLGLLPIAYFIPHLIHNGVWDMSVWLYPGLLELSVTITLLVLRRTMKEKEVNGILLTICTVGCICFFISFLYPLMSKKMAILGILSYFGDNYINSVDRFYGPLMYCNASALLFLISSFIALFKIHDEQENKTLFQVLLFINFSGFLITFSKMVFLAFVFVLIALIILKKTMRQNDFIITIKNSFISIILPSLLFVRLFRVYLINLNIILFLLGVVVFILLYLCICKLLEYLDTKWRGFSYLYLGIIVSCIVFFTVDLVSTPLKINHVSKTNDSIISDFILEKNKDYHISFHVTGDMDNVSFDLYKLYVSDYSPRVEVIKTEKASKIVSFQFKTPKDFEYYFIRISNLNDKTKLVVDDLKINNKEYAINSFLVPYQYIHQLELTKYDRESVTDRLSCYRECLRIIKNNHSIIGEGYNTFGYYALKSDSFNAVSDPHSYLFQLWVDVGIYGPIYVLGLIIMGIVSMLRYPKYEDKHIWFCIFCSCMIILPFDAVYSRTFLKILLMLSFLMVCTKNKKMKD